MTPAPTTPYSAQLGNREPIASMRETSSRIRTLVMDWSPAQFERTYAPGKWTARQILILRCALREFTSRDHRTLLSLKTSICLSRESKKS